MGYMRHHAIVVTGLQKGGTIGLRTVDQARAKAIEIGMAVSEIVNSPVNHYASFFVAPDGSKEGWEESERGDNQRQQFMSWLLETDHLHWVCIQYGDDEGITAIEDHSDREKD